jgi:3-(methylthio)propanoyl-CoA dehydrogenase
MLFVINELNGQLEVNALPGCGEASPETVEVVLEENAKFYSGALLI